VTLQIVASLIDAARGIIYDRHMLIVQATVHCNVSTVAYIFTAVNYAQKLVITMGRGSML
jgi:hypothetical protein